MTRAALVSLLLLCGTTASAQTPPAPQLPPDAATQPPIPKNIDRTLDTPISVDADHLPLAQFISNLRDQTQTNILINWNAVAQTGLARDTPVTLHLKNLPYEEVVKTLLDILPAQKSLPNYQVGDNTLEITTNSALGKGTTYRLYPIARILAYSLAPSATAAPSAPGEAATSDNEKLIAAVLRSELLRAGEPLDTGNHTLAIRGGTLAASLSERGQTVLQHAIALLNAPTRPGQFAPGTAVTASAKHAQEALAKALGPASPATFLALAKDPARYAPSLNLALLPGTDAELSRPAPAIAGTITDGGVLLIGPADTLSRRTFFAAYDLHDPIKRLSAKTRPPTVPADAQASIVQQLQAAVPAPAGWGTAADLSTRPTIMIPYQGVLLIFATPDQHRALTATLQELLK